MDRVQHRSQSEDRHSNSHRGRHHATNRTSGYFRNDGSNESGSTTTTLTPSDTPIDDIIRRVAALRDSSSGNGVKHRSSSHHKTQNTRHSHDQAFKNRNDSNFGGESDSSQPSRSYSMHSQDSVQFKSTSMGNFQDLATNTRPHNNISSSSTKRSSLGLTDSKKSPSKHPSEPDLYQKFQNSVGSGFTVRERQAYNASISSLDSCADGSTTLPNPNSANRSSESSGLGAYMLSAPSSPSKTKSKSGKYKYTSLRNTTGSGATGYGTLSKAMSTSNIDKSDRGTKSSSLHYGYDNIPQTLFGDIPRQARAYNPPAEKDSGNSGSSTPTNLAKFISNQESNVSSEQNRLRSHRTATLRKPTPKKASRSSSESRLPRPGERTVNTSNNNNKISQSTGSGFERYTPAETSQGSILGHTYTLEAEGPGSNKSPNYDNDAVGGGDSQQVTGVRLSWDQTPSSYNLTLYSNKHH